MGAWINVAHIMKASWVSGSGNGMLKADAEATQGKSLRERAISSMRKTSRCISGPFGLLIIDFTLRSS